MSIGNSVLIKRNIILSAIRYFSAESIGARCRKRRFEDFYPLIKNYYSKYGHVNIVDMGGTVEYWKLLSDDVFEKYNINITLVNLKDQSEYIDSDTFSYVKADVCDLSIFHDNQFHIAHSNSVIEHLGGWNRRRLFAKEASRIADSYFIQTPYFWFPVEPHCLTPFFHWLPKEIRILLLRKFNLGHWERSKSYYEAKKKIEGIYLLDKRRLHSLFDNCRIVNEKYLFISKSLTAIKN